MSKRQCELASVLLLDQMDAVCVCVRESSSFGAERASEQERERALGGQGRSLKQSGEQQRVPRRRQEKRQQPMVTRARSICTCMCLLSVRTACAGGNLTAGGTRRRAHTTNNVYHTHTHRPTLGHSLLGAVLISKMYIIIGFLSAVLRIL
jgi:hypothetical protein